MNLYKSVNFFRYHSHLLRSHQISSNSLVGKQIKLRSKGYMILTNAQRNEDLDTSHSLVNNMEPQGVENSSSVISPIHPVIPDLCPQSGTIISPLISLNCPDSSPNAAPLIFYKGVSSHANLENQEVILHMSGLHESDSEDAMSSSLPTENILLKL